MTTKANHIAFKLEPALADLLELRAQAEGAASVSLYAKNLLAKALDQDSELARLRDQVETLTETLDQLREDLRNAMKALLVATTSGKPVTAEQAEAWTTLHFPDVKPAE